MKVDPFPAYCGGRLLWGLWQNVAPPVEGWYEYVDRNWYTVPGVAQDPYCAYSPSDPVLFQQILKNIMNNKIGKGQCAVLIAVTNNNAQKEAVRLLKETGFERAFTGRKNEYGNECTTWIGDMHGKVWKILDAVPPYKNIPVKSAKFG